MSSSNHQKWDSKNKMSTTRKTNKSSKTVKMVWRPKVQQPPLESSQQQLRRKLTKQEQLQQKLALQERRIEEERAKNCKWKRYERLVEWEQGHQAKRTYLGDANEWKQYTRSCLIVLLHGDLIPLVMEYLAMIHFTLVRSFGGTGETDGKLDSPLVMALVKDELIIADSENRRLQVFHAPTGRYLRQFESNSSFIFNDPQCLAANEQTLHFYTYGKMNNEDNKSEQMFRPMVVTMNLSDFKIEHVFTRRRDDVLSLCLADDKLILCENVSTLALPHTGRYKSQISFYTKEGTRVEIITFIDSNQNNVCYKRCYVHESILYAGTVRYKHGDYSEEDTKHDDKILAFDLKSRTHIRTYGSDSPGIWSSRLSTVETTLNRPGGMVVHGSELMVCDKRGNRIVVFDVNDGDVLRCFGNFKEEPGALRRGNFAHTSKRFNQPHDMVLDTKRNELFVCDDSNHVYVFQ